MHASSNGARRSARISNWTVLAPPISAGFVDWHPLPSPLWSGPSRRCREALSAPWTWV